LLPPISPNRPEGSADTATLSFSFSKPKGPAAGRVCSDARTGGGEVIFPRSVSAG